MEAVAAPQRNMNFAGGPKAGAPAPGAASAGGALPASAPRTAPAPEPAGAPADPGPVRGAPWVISTYFAEGLPYTIPHKIASEFFTAAGASLQTIGLASAFGLPWNLKFLWSPLVDMYGTPRRWLLATELAVAVAVAALAWPAREGAHGLIAAGFVLVAAIAATHDIAIDGFYLHALDKRGQAAFTGVRVAAYRVALLAGGLLVALAGFASWTACFTAAGAVMALLALLHALILPRASRAPSAGSIADVFGEADGEAARPLPRPRYFQAFSTFLRQPQIALILAFILLFRAGDAMMFAMSSPLLNSLGLDLKARGLLAVPSTVASIAGSILGGFVVARLGLRRTLFPIALIQSLAILLYVLLAWLRPSLPGIMAIVIGEQLAAGVGTAGLMVFLMRRCSAEYKASHFAIGTALMSVAATVAGSASGFIADRVGFTLFFTIAFAASIPGVALSRWVPAE